MEQTKTYFRKLQPYTLLVGGLLIVGSISAGLGIWHHQPAAQAENQPQAEITDYSNQKVNNSTSNKNHAQPKSQSKKHSSNNQPSTQTNRGQVAGSNTQNYEGNSTAVATPDTTGGSTNSSSDNSESTPNQTKQVAVSLSINANQRGQLKIASDKNQCDVLRQALDTGLIRELDMQYSESHKSYGVYIIDGMGNPNTVQWVYSVNGQSPPRGCSHEPVSNGDSINWQYLNE